MPVKAVYTSNLFAPAFVSYNQECISVSVDINKV